MNKNKLYECDECGKLVKIRSKGKCTYCRSKELPKKSPNKKVTQRLNKFSSFFDEIITLLTPVSQESGRVISNFSKCNLCHVFPKRAYDSVATDINNIVVLTLDEHTIFDQYLDTRNEEKLREEFPNTIKIIQERKKYFLEHVLEEGSLKYFIASL